MIYYGYKRGDDDKIVDWSSVTKSLTDRIDEVEAKRAANRERIEGEIADATQKIGDVPMGNYENINSFMIQTSTDIAENLRVNSALLRAGKMKASEFAKFMQNSLDSIGQYKKIAENYNSLRDKGVSRLNEGKSGWQEAYELERLEKLADLTRTVSVQDPITGTTFNAPIEKDGRPDMSQAESTLYLANMPFVEMDKFDMNAQLDPTVEKYGENVKVIKSLGVNTKSSIKIRKDFEKSVDTFVGSFDSRQFASVLGDFVGGYKGTTDEALRDSDPEKYILVGRDGSNGNFPTYQLTPNQETKAREAIKEQLYMKLDYVETPAAPTSTSSAQIEAGKAREKAKGYVTALQDLFTADDPKKRSAAMANLAGAIGQDRFISMEMNDAGDAIVFTGIDKDDNVRKTQEIPLSGTFDDFVKNYGKILTGTGDVWTYYDEVIDSPDVSSLTPSVGAGGKYEIGFEEDLSQKLTDLASIGNVLDIQPLATENYFLESSKIRDSKKYVQKFIEASQIKGLSYNVDDTKKMTISHPDLGTLPPIRLNRDEEIIASDLKEALYKMYEAATTGKPLEGTTEPEDPAGGNVITAEDLPD
jgi:hypothetical protein